MWPCIPRTVSRPPSEPRRPCLMVSPRRSLQLGSPTTQRAGRRPSAARRATAAQVPCSAGPSSSLVSSSATRSSGRASARRAQATAIAATAPFMSAAPRPYSRPSRTSGANGSLRHAAAGPGGTTSVWPAKAMRGASAPRQYQVLVTPFALRSSAAKPNGAR